MHNFNLTTNPTASQSVTNLSILEESCNANSYSYWVGANDMYDAGSTTAASFINGTNTTPTAWALAKMVDSSVGFYVRKHSDWKCGAFDLKLHMQSSLATGDILFRVAVTPSADLAAFQAPTFCNFTSSISSAGVLYVNTLMSSDLRVSSSIDRSKHGVYVVVERNGSNGRDTVNDDLYIYGVELVYNETKRVIGDMIKK